MGHVMLWVSIFIMGMAAGTIVTAVLGRLTIDKSRRTELVLARSRILAGIKEQHEREILDEIFHAAKAIDSEINSSLRRLLDRVEKLLVQLREDHGSASPSTPPTVPR